MSNQQISTEFFKLNEELENMVLESLSSDSKCIYNTFLKKKSRAALDFHELGLFPGPEQ